MYMPSVQDGLSLPFPLSNVLWGIFAVALIVFAISSTVLLYHWRSYGMNNKKILFAQTLYITVSIGIIIVAIISIIFS